MKFVLRSISNGWIIEIWGGGFISYELSFLNHKDALAYLAKYLKPEKKPRKVT